MDRLEKVKYIKSREEPPYNINDPYYLRKPWQKFGGVSSGICMCWCWFRDDVILSKITDEEIEMALNEFNGE